MRFSCPTCQAIFQTVSGGAAPVRVVCAGCGAEMVPSTAEAPLAGGGQVVELRPDRIPTRRYDLHELRARLEEERVASRPAQAAPQQARQDPPAGTDAQVWHVSVQGRQVGPLSHGGLEGLRARGLLTPASLVWRQGWPVWAAAEAVPELRPILGLSLVFSGQGAPTPPSLPEPSARDLDATTPSGLPLPFGPPFGSDDVTDPHAFSPPLQPSEPPPLEAPAPLEAGSPALAEEPLPAPTQTPPAALVGPPPLPEGQPPPPPSDLTPMPSESVPNLAPLPPRRRSRSASSERMFGAVADEGRSPRPVAIGLALLIAALGLGILLASSKSPPAPAASSDPSVPAGAAK